jgi:hypothetical protein
MQPVGEGVRAYFAPVDRGSHTPSIFDPAAAPAFDPNNPAAPWIDAGWADKFTRTPQTKVEAARLGPASAVSRQFRVNQGATVELEFREWGKLQMALAGGAQHMNVLAGSGAPGGTSSGSGGAAQPAIALQSGSTAQELMLGAAASGFQAGDIVAVDIDYAQQTGYIGTGIAAAYVTSAQVASLQADYIRRVTLNVARVAAVTDHSLQLERPLLGGAPATAARVQKVVAFVDREGGNFFQEWSALFVLPESSGGRICFYYPRLQAAGSPREGTVKLGEPLRATTLHALFEAMAAADANDGEMVYCYRIYFPPARAALY